MPKGEKMIHSVLIIGQSNMAGRGFSEDVFPIEYEGESLKVLRNGRWIPMYTPVNPDRKTACVNLAESFAKRYHDEKGVDVGIIPCADGGTCLDQWAVGGLLFDHACYMAELASRTSTIAAVLWHQGESDTTPERAPLYEEKVMRIFDALRRRLNLFDVPFIVGGLGDFVYDFYPSARHESIKIVNNTLQSLPNKYKMIGFASAEGLAPNPDNLHFSAPALREFGLRYYEAFLKLEDKDKVFVEKPDELGAIRSEIEYL